jgi:hypothetical protein
VSRPRDRSLRLHRLGIRRLPADESVTWEIDHHLAELVDRLVAEGLSRDEALHAARARFGDPARYGRPMRRSERWGNARSRLGAFRSDVGQTLSSVLRDVRRHPTYAASVMVTMGLGLGANATMYGIVDRLLLRPPEHIVQPDRVRNVFMSRPNPVTGTMTPQAAFSYPDYVDLKAHRGMSDGRA